MMINRVKVSEISSIAFLIAIFFLYGSLANAADIIRVTVENPGTGTGQVTSSAASSGDFEFSGWSGGYCIGKGNCLLGSFIPRSSKTLIANFNAPPCIKIVYSFGSCQINGLKYGTVASAEPAGCIVENPVLMTSEGCSFDPCVGLKNVQYQGPPTEGSIADYWNNNPLYQGPPVLVPEPQKSWYEKAWNSTKEIGKDIVGGNFGDATSKIVDSASKVLKEIGGITGVDTSVISGGSGVVTIDKEGNLIKDTSRSETPFTGGGVPIKGGNYDVYQGYGDYDVERIFGKDYATGEGKTMVIRQGGEGGIVDEYKGEPITFEIVKTEPKPIPEPIVEYPTQLPDLSPALDSEPPVFIPQPITPEYNPNIPPYNFNFGDTREYCK